ncbi:hypothetical protein [Prosthecobacter sp.]|uniref:hypothetical protein n=1 Tax=Prosthecobacter sp. TaxID=1965333 RepID=UPI003784A869
MSLRILIAHSRPGQRGDATAIYCGESGSDLAAAQSAATWAPSFSIIHSPDAIRKNNPLFDPKAQPPSSAPAAPKIELPADLKGLKKEELAAAALAAINRIGELEATIAELRGNQQQQEQQQNEPPQDENSDPKSSEVAV